MCSTGQFTAFVTQTEALFLIDDKIVTHFHPENKYIKPTFLIITKSHDS